MALLAHAGYRAITLERAKLAAARLRVTDRHFGQLSTNDPAIPGDLGHELERRYGVVLVQEQPRAARPGR